MKKIFALVAALLSTTPVAAQNVLQSPVFVTPNHAAAWVTNGVLGDAGTAQSPVLSSIGTVGQGNTICANSGPQTGPYNQLCLGANLGSAAQLVLQSFGGASNQNLSFVINGTTYTFPFVATGVVGPGTTVVGDLLCWNNTIGTLVSDCTTFTFPNSNLKLLGSSTGITTFTSGNSSATNYTLTIPANTGTLAELNLAQAWTAAQTFNNSDILLLGSSTGATTFTSANSGASNFTLTVPAVTDTLATIGTAQTWTAAQTFTNSDILLLGSSTGTTTFTSGNSSVTNYTLTVPANTGTLAELNLAQTWTAAQTFTNSDILLLGSSTGATTFTSANSGASNFTATIPANTGTIAELNLGQTWTAAQTFTNSDIKLLGSSTGATTFTSANGGASNFTLTVPAVTDTLATISTAQTFSATETFSGQIVSTFGVPTISSGNCGTGTNGSVTGTNQSGLITIGAAATTTCTVSFSATIIAPNACVLFPANATAAATGTTVARVSSVGTTNFVVTGSALANANYYYICL